MSHASSASSVSLQVCASSASSVSSGSLRVLRVCEFCEFGQVLHKIDAFCECWSSSSSADSTRYSSTAELASELR